MIPVENLSKSFNLAQSGRRRNPGHGGGIGACGPRRIITLRPDRWGYVSQVLRALPCLPARQVVTGPTAKLNAISRVIVLSLTDEAKALRAAISGIFHDYQTTRQDCDRLVDVAGFAPPRAA